MIKCAYLQTIVVQKKPIGLFNDTFKNVKNIFGKSVLLVIVKQ